jgi:hypothetical protein
MVFYFLMIPPLKRTPQARLQYLFVYPSPRSGGTSEDVLGEEPFIKPPKNPCT